MYDFRSMRFLRPVFLVVFSLATISSSFVMAQSCKQLTIRDSDMPTYPLKAYVTNIQGTVKLRATVSSSGSITGVTVIDGPEPLRAAALDYIHSWVLLVGSKNSNCTLDTKVDFRLTGQVMEFPNSYVRFTRDDISRTTLERHPIKSTTYNDPLVPEMRN
jgi:Gram-negative bacterial TonB protein C-terminal